MRLGCAKKRPMFGIIHDHKQQSNLDDRVNWSQRDLARPCLTQSSSNLYLISLLLDAMRNLSLISTWESTIPSANITATTFDLDENVLYASSERDTSNGEIEVELWKIDQSQGFNKTPVRLDPSNLYCYCLMLRDSLPPSWLQNFVPWLLSTFPMLFSWFLSALWQRHVRYQLSCVVEMSFWCPSRSLMRQYV